MNKSFAGIGRNHWLAGLILAISSVCWIVCQPWLQKPAEIKYVDYDENCDLRAGPCKTILEDGGQVSFAIQPRTIPVTGKLTLEVTVSGLDVDTVSVDINGVDMKMPPNIIDLYETGDGRYSGQGSLSYCTRSFMEWESLIQLQTSNKKIKVPFRFITSK